jgi:hypothetical protein
MIVLQVFRKVLGGLGLVVLVAACSPPDPRVDLGVVQLRLWQPLDQDYVADATRLEMEILLDGIPRSTVFQGGAPLEVDDLTIEAGGQNVAIHVKSRGATLADAAGRSGNVWVEPPPTPEKKAPPAPVVTAVFGPAGAPFTLHNDVDDRVGAAWCAGPAGALHGIGGLSGNVVMAGSTVADPSSRNLVNGPNPVHARAGSVCAATDEALVLFGGCDEAQSPLGGLEVARLPGGIFEPVEGAATPAGCGAALALDGETLWLIHPTRVERRTLPDLEMTHSIQLPQPRYFASAAAAEGALLIAGGSQNLDQGLPHGEGLRVRLVDGDLQVEALANLADARVFATRTGPVALKKTGIHTLGQGGPAEKRVTVDLPAPGPTTQLVALPFGAFAILDNTADRLRIQGPQGSTQMLLTRSRPGAALLSDGGLAAFLVGGDGPLEAVVLHDAP